MFLLLGLVCPLKGKADSKLADAAESGRYEDLVRLLENDKDAVDVSQPDGTTALHWAAHRGDAAMIKLLIEAGAEVEKKNYFGITPLFLACQEGSAETVGLLLEAGADPNSTISGGKSA